MFKYLICVFLLNFPTKYQLKTFRLSSIRNLRKPSAKIFDRIKGPLIGSVLWAHDEPNEVNYCIKNILKLYVNYVCIGFPSEDTKIIGVSSVFNCKQISPCHIEIDLYFLSAAGKSNFQRI